MKRSRVLLIGAYGQFGRRIAAELAKDDLHLVLAGRSRSMADALLPQLAGRATVSTARLDVSDLSLAADVVAFAPDIVIHTAGPFQTQDYRVAEAALAAGAHYIDLADGREFVSGIGRLDAQARAAGRWVVSGASSVPGLSAAVVEAHLRLFSCLSSIESAISPGNRTARGLATTSAILGYVGKPIPLRRFGTWSSGYGWQSCRRIRVPGVGARWVARCDVPDLAVLPQRYPQVDQCDFRAGLELRRMHFGLWLGSWLVRVGLVRSLQPWAGPLLRLSDTWRGAGSDTGVMVVDLRGRGIDDRPLHARWTLVARDGSGPQVPATAAVVLTRKLANGTLPGAGARPCLDLFSLDAFLAALSDHPIDTTLDLIR